MTWKYRIFGFINQCINRKNNLFFIKDIEAL